MGEMVTLLKRYFEDRKSGTYSETVYRQQLLEIGIKEERLEETLLEMEDEWDKEVLVLEKMQSGKKKRLFGSVVALVGGILMILSALGDFWKGQLHFYPFLAIALALAVALNGHNDVKAYSLRQKRLELKWKQGR